MLLEIMHCLTWSMLSISPALVAGLFAWEAIRGRCRSNSSLIVFYVLEIGPSRPFSAVRL